jgi:hypothetical protein
MRCLVRSIRDVNCSFSIKPSVKLSISPSTHAVAWFSAILESRDCLTKYRPCCFPVPRVRSSQGSREDWKLRATLSSPEIRPKPASCCKSAHHQTGNCPSRCTGSRRNPSFDGQPLGRGGRAYPIPIAPKHCIDMCMYVMISCVWVSGCDSNSTSKERTQPRETRR